MSIAIVGIGCIFPKAFGAKEFWQLLAQGRDGITDVPETHWSAEDYYHEDPKAPDHTYCKRGGFISPISYDPAEFGIPPNCLEATDTSQLLGLTVAKMALEDAGYGGSNGFNRDRTSVILGVTGTQELVIPLSSRLGYPIWKKSLKDSGIPQEKTDEVIARISESYVPWQENSFPGLLGNVVPGRIANRLNLGGTNCAVDAACASSLSAVNLAMLELLSNRCDMAVTGGVDTLNDIFMHMCFSQTGVLSHTGDAKPFSKDADGTVLGEGIGMVVLKRLEDAEKDKNRIYCVIKALGSSSDGRSGSIYAPDATGQGKALAKAYKEANVDPATVELVEAHGTGTRVGDAVEFKALAELFGKSGKNREKCALGSVKSNIGHTKAAAGAAGLIKAALSLHNKVIPPTLKVDAPDPDLHIDETFFYLNSEPMPWLGKEDHPRRSGVSAFGFGGSNFHVVLEEYGKKKNDVSWDTNIEIIALSGPGKKDIEDKLQSFIKTAQKNNEDKNSCHQEISFDASVSRNSFSHKDTYRLLLILDLQKKDPFSVLTDAMEAIKNKPEASFSTKNIFFGSPSLLETEQPGKLAFVFPGQGSQYTGMGRNLACAFPEAQDIFEKAEKVFSDTNKTNDKRLSDFIYPLPFHLVDKKEAENQLQNTKVAQPAIGAVSLLMLKVLERFGLKPDAVCGHSFGELTALCSAKRIDEDTFHLLSAARGKFMAETGKKGSMLAVKAPLHELDSLVKTSSLDVIVANRNSHEQGVLSGPAEDINKAKDLCAQKGFKSTILPVSAAFHSKLVKDAAAPFKELLDKVEIKSSDINVFSNTTAAPYPDDSSEAKAVLGNHLTSPVNFADEVENLFKEGIKTFVEVGPKPVLTGLVKSILKGKEFNTICLDGSSGRKSGLRDLAATLCHIASLGHNIELGAWGGPVEKPRKKRMHMPISGANYRPNPKLKSKPVNRPNQESMPDLESKPEIEQRIKPDLKQENRQEQTLKPEITPVIKEYNAPKEDSTSFEGIHKKAMDTKKPIQADFIIDALKVVQKGLKSMQELQTQTAEAHNKFLENQSQASRTMQTMMENAQRMAAVAMGASSTKFKMPEPISQTYFPTIKEQSDQKLYQEERRTVKTERLPEETVETTSTPDFLDPDLLKTDNAQKGAIETSMLKVVSELTGYPVEMLDMDMDIEADLGIDSIKRVEILSAFEEEMPGLASVSPNIIGEMNTLGQITDYLVGINRNDAPAPMPEVDNLKSSENSSAKIAEALLGVVSELTGYPVDMLDMDMDIEADLGIDSIKRVEILSAFEEKMPGLSSISPDIIGEMNTLGQIFNYLTGTVKDDADTLQPLPADDRTPHDIIPGDIEENLLKVVSDLTGYPVDMLDMDMDIEADLGIDSIKRVEILSAFEEKMPDLPTLSPDVLGEIKTLGEIYKYLTDTIQVDTIKPDTIKPDTIKKEKSSTTQDISAVKTSADKDSLPDKESVDDIVERNIVKMVEKPFPLIKRCPYQMTGLC